MSLCITWVIDDESYFTLIHSTINGNDNFYSSDVSLTPSCIKYSPKFKFEDKLLVWICFSARDVSKPFFVLSKMAINQNVYLKDCIKQRLLPFINTFHLDGNYFSGLISSHYANTVVDRLRTKNVKFIQKKITLPIYPNVD